MSDAPFNPAVNNDTGDVLLKLLASKVLAPPSAQPPPAAGLGVGPGLAAAYLAAADPAFYSQNVAPALRDAATRRHRDYQTPAEQNQQDIENLHGLLAIQSTMENQRAQREDRASRDKTAAEGKAAELKLKQEAADAKEKAAQDLQDSVNGQMATLRDDLDNTNQMSAQLASGLRAAGDSGLDLYANAIDGMRQRYTESVANTLQQYPVDKPATFQKGDVDRLTQMRKELADVSNTAMAKAAEVQRQKTALAARVPTAQASVLKGKVALSSDLVMAEMAQQATDLMDKYQDNPLGGYLGAEGIAPVQYAESVLGKWSPALKERTEDTARLGFLLANLSAAIAHPITGSQFSEVERKLYGPLLTSTTAPPYKKYQAVLSMRSKLEAGILTGIKDNGLNPDDITAQRQRIQQALAGGKTAEDIIREERNSAGAALGIQVGHTVVPSLKGGEQAPDTVPVGSHRTAMIYRGLPVYADAHNKSFVIDPETRKPFYFMEQR